VVRGLPRITIGDSDRNYLPGEKITIPQGIKHKIAAGNDGCIIVEVAYGVCDEEDIIRYEDQYGRAIPK
jgi:D-lyxose ketol-isomerase